MNKTAERDDEWGILVRPEVILPAQFFGALRRQPPCRGERRLMLAILEDALDCFQKHLCARRHRERQLFWDAEAWFLSEAQAPFSFEHICGVLDFDPAYIREGLQQWTDRQLAQRSFELAALNPKAASTRAAPAANRHPARQQRWGARRRASSGSADSMRTSEATISSGSDGFSVAPSRPARVNGEWANAAVGGARRLRSA